MHHETASIFVDKRVRGHQREIQHMLSAIANHYDCYALCYPKYVLTGYRPEAHLHGPLYPSGANNPPGGIMGDDFYSGA